MADYQHLLSEDEDVAKAYRRAHVSYIEARNALGENTGIGQVAEIAGISAGGMPERVKCLHALAAQTLACGKKVNPIGDLALADLKATALWDSEHCYCE